MATKIDKWIEAQRRHRLSDLHVQMARELGLNPDKLGKIDNHDQESWKAPLPQFIEKIYYKRFKRESPTVEIKPLKQIVKEQKIAQEKKKKEKLKRRNMTNSNPIIALFNSDKILEAVFSLREDSLPFNKEDVLTACENRTCLNNKFFRVVKDVSAISVKEIGVCTLDKFDKIFE